MPQFIAGYMVQNTYGIITVDARVVVKALARLQTNLFGVGI
jgi:hypothetical protein